MHNILNLGIDPKTKVPRIMNSKELMVLQPKFYFEPAHIIHQLGMDLSLMVLYELLSLICLTFKIPT